MLNLDPAFGYNIQGSQQHLEDDISILLHDGSPHERGDAVKLLPFTCAAVCAPSLLREHTNTPMADLLAMPLLHQKELPSFWQNFVNDAGFAELSVPCGMVIDSVMVSIQSALEGLGVALLPVYMIERELEKGCLVLAHKHIYESDYSYYLTVNEHRRNWPPLIHFQQWLNGVAAISIDDISRHKGGQ
jgi:LysR family glycine cleavage system transcriptional activator